MTGAASIFLLVLFALVAGALLFRWIRRQVNRARLARVRRRGHKGEREAPRVLAKAGYRVLAEQADLEATMTVDGEEHPYSVRADLLAEKGGATYVVEVKTGAKAPDPLKSATRRQLLEYRVLYDAEGVLLLDMEKERIRRVEWPRLGDAPRGAIRGRSRRILLLIFAAGLVLGLMVGLLIAHAGSLS